MLKCGVVTQSVNNLPLSFSPPLLSVFASLSATKFYFAAKTVESVYF